MQAEYIILVSSPFFFCSCCKTAEKKVTTSTVHYYNYRSNDTTLPTILSASLRNKDSTILNELCHATLKQKTKVCRSKDVHMTETEKTAMATPTQTSTIGIVKLLGSHVTSMHVGDDAWSVRQTGMVMVKLAKRQAGSRGRGPDRVGNGFLMDTVYKGGCSMD
ncbi:hypothetical protein BaRGS_00022323 [Batillaria attramentaria]|uniref:Uncharacterized protein n=1 Tax=Batillaria attramentaria TaxID=370345 RepID=A0ABD0KGZ1_9CAEN